MCYVKQQMVICFKATENFGATWSIILPARGGDREEQVTVLLTYKHIGQCPLAC